MLKEKLIHRHKTSLFLLFLCGCLFLFFSSYSFAQDQTFEPVEETTPIMPPDENQVPLPSLNISFPDLEGHWAKKYVEEIVTLNIASGYENDLFGVNDVISRAQMSKMAYRAFIGTNEPQATSQVFDDVPQTHWAAGYIQVLKAKGIISGYGDGKMFGPDDELTRAQGLKILLGSLRITPRTNLPNAFSDVPPSWFTDWVLEGAELGVVSGYEGTDQFGPNNPLLRGEVAKMISFLLPMM